MLKPSGCLTQSKIEMKLKYRSKEKESEFIQKLQDFFSKPDNLLSLVPDCMDNSILCPFDSYKKKLSRISGPAIGKLSGSADQFLSAIGETYRVMESESAPIMGLISTPYGNVDYAKRGSTDPMVLAGVQNFSSTVWRMLSFSSLVQTKKVSVYSSEHYYIASCKGNPPPREFILDAFQSEKTDDLSVNEEEIIFGTSGDYMNLNIGSQILIKVYQDSKSNVIRILLRHMLVPDISRTISIQVPFLEDVSSEIPAQYLNQYLSGQLEARNFIRNVSEYRKKIALSKGLYLLEGMVFNSTSAFLGEMFDPEESKILEKYLEQNGPVSIDTKSARKLLEILWPKYGKDILSEYFPDIDQNSLKTQAGDPLKQIEMIRRKIDQSKASSLVAVEPWSSDSAMLIDMVRDYLSVGGSEMLRKWEKLVGQSSMFNSIYYAFTISLNERTNQQWRFSSEQMMLGEKLAEGIRDIIATRDASINEKILRMKQLVR